MIYLFDQSGGFEEYKNLEDCLKVHSDSKFPDSCYYYLVTTKGKYSLVLVYNSGLTGKYKFKDCLTPRGRSQFLKLKDSISNLELQYLIESDENDWRLLRLDLEEFKKIFTKKMFSVNTYKHGILI